MLNNRTAKRYLKEGIHNVYLARMFEQEEPQQIPQEDGSSKILSPYIELNLTSDDGVIYNHRFWVSESDDLDKFDIQVGHIKDQTGIPGIGTAEILSNLIETKTHFQIMIAKNYSDKTNKWYTNCYFNEDTIKSTTV